MRPIRRRPALLAAWLLGALVAPGTANASPSARLAYARSVDAGTCPDEAGLRRAVAARFGYDPFFPWARQTVIVQVWRERGRYASRVQVVDEQGLTRGTRELVSDEADCADLFRATALAISIALDAAVATSPVDHPSSRADDAAPAEAPKPAASQAPETREPLRVPSNRPGPEPPAAERPLSNASLGLVAIESEGLAPNVSLGGALSAAVRARGLSFGVEARFSASLPTAVVPVGAHVEALDGVLALVPCVHASAFFVCPVGEFGWVGAFGLGLSHDRAQSTWFLAAGGRLGVDLPVSRSVYLRVYAEAVVDLDRPEFIVDDEPSWTAPLVAGSLGAGFGAKIP
jgi:hypothetical protein